jgi:hypothetical protein
MHPIIQHEDSGQHRRDLMAEAGVGRLARCTPAARLTLEGQKDG